MIQSLFRIRNVEEKQILALQNATTHTIQRIGDKVKATANYVQIGKWSKCAYCGAIVKGSTLDSHWCSAPWQSKDKEIPEDWEPPFNAIQRPLSAIAMMATDLNEGKKETVLEEAQRLVHGDRHSNTVS